MLKYKKPEPYRDNTTLLGYLLSEIYPLSTNSIVSNTLSGGKNILLDGTNLSNLENRLIECHNINTEQFYKLVEATKRLHKEFKSELGIICGFDFIYDKNRNKWYLLEYHSRPMLGDYSRRQNLKYETEEDKLTADGIDRATALTLALKKTS